MSKDNEIKQPKVSSKPDTQAKASKKGRDELSSEDLARVTGGRKAGE